VHLSAPSGPFRYKVFHDLCLGVDGNGPADQLAKVNVLPIAVELQVDPAMLKTLAVEPAGQPGRAEQPNATVLEHASPLAGFAVSPAAALDQDRLDAAEREQVREQQPGRARADDAYLGANGCPPLCAIRT